MTGIVRIVARAAAVVVGAISAGCGSSGGGGGGTTAPLPPAPAISANVVPGPDVVPPPGSIYLGAFVSTSGLTSPPLTDLTTFESQIGRKMALTQHYYGFYDTFPGTAEAADLANGRIPIDSWNCQFPNATIVAGHQDTAIRARADAFKKYGKPIFLRYMWEMNLASSPTNRASCYDAATDSPNGVFSPSEYVSAWDRIRALFASEGATNVIWLWCPSGTVNPLAYYPGANEVDWIGFDKYDDTNIAFDQTFLRPYGLLTGTGKPIMIAETGAAAANQPTFFASAPSELQSEFPQVAAFVYFDSSGFKGDWALDQNGTAAFATMGRDPYFSAQVP
jgi:hypothetical protein